MSRKSKIEPVRSYLAAEIKAVELTLSGTIKDEDFVMAAVLKGFKNKLKNALELCREEKLKGDKNET